MQVVAPACSAVGNPYLHNGCAGSCSLKRHLTVTFHLTTGKHLNPLFQSQKRLVSNIDLSLSTSVNYLHCAMFFVFVFQRSNYCCFLVVFCCRGATYQGNGFFYNSCRIRAEFVQVVAPACSAVGNPYLHNGTRTLVYRDKPADLYVAPHGRPLDVLESRTCM